MYQKDYIIRMIEQLSIFIRKLLKIDINIDREQYIIEFEKMLLSNFKSNDIDNLNMDIIHNYVEDGISKIKLATLFYKASIIYFEANKEVSFKCHRKARSIENLEVNTINPFINNDQNKELSNYRKESLRLHEG